MSIIMTKRIKRQDEDAIIHFAAACPLKDIYHIGSIKQGLQIETGLPVLFTAATQEEIYNMIYSEWEMVEQLVPDPDYDERVDKLGLEVVASVPEFARSTETEPPVCQGTPREFEFTPYTIAEQADLDAVLDIINSTDVLTMVSVPRPNSTDKLLIFSEYALSVLPVDVQLQLAPYKAAKDGQRLKKDEL